MKVSKMHISSMTWIYIIASLEALMYFIFIGPVVCYDTWSYLASWEVIKYCDIDSLRTPIYPIFLGVTKFIVGQKYLFNTVAIIQSIVFIWSLRFFKTIVDTLVQSKYLKLAILLGYILLPGIYGWCFCILTECFAIVFTIIFIYSALKIWENNRPLKYIILFGSTLILAPMLRPSFLYIFPLAFIFFIVYTFKRKASRIPLSLATIIPCILIFAYALSFKNNYGILSLSRVGDSNQLSIMRDEGTLSYDVLEKENLSFIYERFNSPDSIEAVKNRWNRTDDENFLIASSKTKDTTDYAPYHRAVVSLYSVNPGLHIKNNFSRARRAGAESLFANYVFYNSPKIMFLIWFIPYKIQYSNIYMLLLISGIILIVYCYKKRKFPLITVLIYLLIFFNTLLSITGAHAEWARLIVPSMPFVLILLGLIFDGFRWRGIKHLE